MSDTDFAVMYKLGRASTHLHTLDRRIKRFLNGKANGVVNDFYSEPDYLIINAITSRPPPPSCSALIGETLYTIRAALDYMACELARYNKQPVDDHVEFPIFKERDRFRNPATGKLTNAVEKRMGLIDPKHQAVIEDEQPFQGRHGRPEDDPLWLLYLLSNYDRHQFLHLTSMITRASFHGFSPPEAAARLHKISFTYGTFEGKTEVARFAVLDGPAVDVNVQSDVAFDVAFHDKGPGAGRPVLNTLAGMIVRVGEIIQRLVAVP